MGVKDSNYQIVYEGEGLLNFRPAGIVFFQRSRSHGGGWWLGRTHPDGFEFIFNHPIRMYDGLVYLANRNSVPLPGPDDFCLE